MARKMGDGVWGCLFGVFLMSVVKGVCEKAINVLSSGENCLRINAVTCLFTYIGKVKTPVENMPLEVAQLWWQRSAL